MSFDKTYPNRKDWRRPYYDSRRFDATCRSNGGCPRCERNRLHKHRRREPIGMVEEYYEEEMVSDAIHELGYLRFEDCREWPPKFHWLRQLILNDREDEIDEPWDYPEKFVVNRSWK